MKKITFVKQLTFFIALFCAVNFGFGQSIFTNPITGTNPGQTAGDYTTNQIVVPNITVSGIRKGIGIGGVAANDRYNANSWNTAAIDPNAYFEFTITPNAGYKIDFVSFFYVSQRSTGNGPTSFAFRSSTDAFASNIGTSTETGTTINLSGAAYQNITAAITFRFYAWDANAGTGTFSINDFTFNGVVSALPCSSPTVTWSGGAWSPISGPNINTPVILVDSYDTNTNGGSFSACSLTVNDNATLNIADSHYVEVQNELTVEALGSITVQPSGSFVQNNDASINLVSGTITVDKVTAPMDAWYEYTYWSSPVSGAKFEDAIDRSEPSRRYIFNGQNFLDATYEINNNGATLTGQDDIDDDNNDWFWVSGTTVMEPGKGYASTLTELDYSIAPGLSNKTFRFTFEGPFNNGLYDDIPIYRNDSELNDYNWNFIGNPYPSAIDADMFLSANTNIATNVEGTGYVDGAIFLWSQDTDPLSTANGNQALNFSNDDYAIINVLGTLAGGDGLQPTRYIPSGQGFFVSMSNSGGTLFSGDIWTANVTFNNSMRVLNNGMDNNNGQFFKNSNSKNKTTSVANKLWVNLTSDNGVFNQILVGYVNGATNNDDGMAYDTNKYPTKGAALYSIIEGSTKKFAIQGKAANSINEDETIQLGFKTSIDVATLYKLSVAQLEGSFLTGNTIYLRDNLLNTEHNLSASEYTFTSAVGEFNSRFTIAFTAKALSNNTFNLNENTVKITSLDNNNVSFKASNNLNINTVSIYDMLGRELYTFKGKNNEETYRLSNLNNTVIIAKIALSNGAVITKKAFIK